MSLLSLIDEADSRRTSLSGGAATFLSGHARTSLTAIGDNFTNRSAPDPERPKQKGTARSRQGPSTTRADTQRPTRITLRREQCGEPISPCRASSRADRWRAQPGSTQSGREAGSGRPSGKGRPGSPENGGQAPNRFRRLSIPRGTHSPTWARVRGPPPTTRDRGLQWDRPPQVR